MLEKIDGITKTMTQKSKYLSAGECVGGLVMVAASYLPHFQSPRDYGFWGSLLFGALYYGGGILLSNYAIMKMSRRSMLQAILGTRKNRWSFIKLGLIGAVPFSLAVSTFGGLWYFPHWSAIDYYVLGYLLLGWVFYFYFLTACYIAFKLAFDMLIPQRKPVSKYYDFERRYYKALGVIGGWVAIMVITVGLQDSRWLTNFHVEVNKPQTPYLYWYWWLIAVIAWVILCEFMEYYRRRSSLLKDTLHGYYTPLIAVFLCGITLAVTNEFQNLPINLWHYANFPWISFTIYKIPLFIVLCWPIQILAFIEFWRAFGDKRASEVLFSNSFRRPTKQRDRVAKVKRRALAT